MVSILLARSFEEAGLMETSQLTLLSCSACFFDEKWVQTPYARESPIGLFICFLCLCWLHKLSAEEIESFILQFPGFLTTEMYME